MPHLAIGSSPFGEDCAQIGTIGYTEKAHVECQAFRDQLIRVYRAAHDGKQPPCRLYISSNPHDFGTYYMVDAEFEDGDVSPTYDAALWFENNTPELWDAEARQVLGLPEALFSE